MKKIQLLILIASLALLAMVSTTCMTAEECKKYKADGISVKVKFYAHNLTAGDHLNFYVEKSPCGESATGRSDVEGNADNFGDYESTEYGYNLNNSYDRLYLGTDYKWSESHKNEIKYSGHSLQYDTLKYFRNKVYKFDLDYYPPVVHNLWETARSRRQTTMKYCYSLPYLMIFGEPPANLTKEILINKMTKEAGYKVREEGKLTAFITFKEGDVIYFDDNSIPDPNTAPHVAVVIGHKIWQILFWTVGGEFDGPRDAAYFVNKRTLYNPYTGMTSTSAVTYSYYKAYNK